MAEAGAYLGRFRMPSRAVAAFVLLTFAITWGLVGIYILRPAWAAATFGEISGAHPFFFVATWAPAIAAFALVLVYGGLAGLRAFLSRLLLWRCSAGWVAFILVGIPLVFVAGSLIKGGPVLAPLPPGGAGAVIAGLATMLMLGPVEEFGWRGVAQPILQRHLAPVLAGAVIGVVWGVWHLPAFYLVGNGIRRLEFPAVLRRQRHPCGDRHAGLQPVARQSLVADPVSLAAHQSGLAGRTALRHLASRGGGGGRRLVEPCDDVHPRRRGAGGHPRQGRCCPLVPASWSRAGRCHAMQPARDLCLERPAPLA